MDAHGFGRQCSVGEQRSSGREQIEQVCGEFTRHRIDGGGDRAFAGDGADLLLPPGIRSRDDRYPGQAVPQLLRTGVAADEVDETAGMLG